MNKLTKNDEEFLSRVNEVLHYLWDPIGISDEPNARDEYDSYSLSAFSLLKKKAHPEEITKYLTEISTHSMGLNPNIQHDKNIAEILIGWANYFEEKESFIKNPLKTKH